MLEFVFGWARIIFPETLPKMFYDPETQDLELDLYILFYLYYLFILIIIINSIFWGEF